MKPLKLSPRARTPFGGLLRIAAAIALLVAVPLSAGANVRKEGDWPAADKKVSFDFDGKPSEGLAKLAGEAGWSLVVSKGVAQSEHDVKIAVDGQPADAVLEALFAESDVVARRNGTLVTITPVQAAAPGAAGATAGVTPPTPPAPPAPPAAAAPLPPPVPTVRGEDRNAFGSSITVEKDEIVHSVTVTGGSAKIYGTVTGDLVVAGGSAKITDGGRVVGNATAFGGSLKVERGGRVDGNVGIVGGSLKREEGAIIGGKVVDSTIGHRGNVKVSHADGELTTSVEESKPSSSHTGGNDAVHSFGQSITNMSLLFVLGCVLLALATGKMERLRVEVAAHPMRSFALGIVGSLAGTVALVALCVTLVGIPFAVLALLLGVFSVYGAICTVLTTFGAAVAAHKTQNPYVHLLIGCIAFLLVGAIPYLGGFVTLVITMIAIGTLVSTRLAGALDRRGSKAQLV